MMNLTFPQPYNSLVLSLLPTYSCGILERTAVQLSTITLLFNAKRVFYTPDNIVL